MFVGDSDISVYEYSLNRLINISPSTFLNGYKVGASVYSCGIYYVVINYNRPDSLCNLPLVKLWFDTCYPNSLYLLPPPPTPPASDSHRSCVQIEFCLFVSASTYKGEHVWYFFFWYERHIFNSEPVSVW